MVHGKASIDHISAAFDEGEINSKNAEIELAFEGKVNMDLTTEHTELDFSDRITTNSSRMDGNKKYVSAFIGDGTMKKNLSIHMEHGSLEIR